MGDAHDRPEKIDTNALRLYHGTWIESLGQILKDGHLSPSVTTKKPSEKSLVYLSFSFTKAADYGDVVFEIPFSRLEGEVDVRTTWGEVTTDKPVEIHLHDIMIFDNMKPFKELR